MVLVPLINWLTLHLFGGIMAPWLAWTIGEVILIAVVCLVLMLGVAGVILADRKIWAAVHLRRGPNVV
jgi:NADH-quinone oxidoreductase subunit H